jgi:putative transposase
LAPEGRKRNRPIQCSYEQKKAAVIDLCTRDGTAREIAAVHGIDRDTIYRWKHELLGKEQGMPMSSKPDPMSEDPKDLLEAIAALELEKKRLELEVDILTETAKLLKKDPSVDPGNLSNLEKAMLIGALKEKHRLKDLLKATDLPRSSYYYQRAVLHSPAKYAVLGDQIQEIFENNYRCYGYRRIHAELKKEGIIVSEKVVRRIMAANHLVVRQKKRRYKSYMGEVSPAPDNLVARNFHAGAPNAVWLTDISEFGIPAGKIYLSPIIDCMDGLAVSWSIGLRPTAELANTSLKAAVRGLNDDERPIIHSDRGGHYRWPEWLKITEDYGLIRSMSAKGCPPDNAACEGFFGRIKNEFFYGRDWRGVSLETFMEELDRYLRWYNQDRVKESLGWMSPIQYRVSLGLVA